MPLETDVPLSTNARPDSDDFQKDNWVRTVNAVKRLEDSYPERFDPKDSKSPNGYYKDPSRQGERFPIIGRDVFVEGGVYLGGGKREIILVPKKTTSKAKDTLGNFYDTVHARISRRMIHHLAAQFVKGLVGGKESQTNISEGKIVQDVFKMILEKMKYDENLVESIIRDREDSIIPLGEFLDKGAGVCRHQALLAAYVLQRLHKEPLLGEKVKISVDRNEGFGGAHAWVRVTLSNGEVMIIDPAQNYCGLLKEAGERTKGWSYERPEDMRKIPLAKQDAIPEILPAALIVAQVRNVTNPILELSGMRKDRELSYGQDENIEKEACPVLVGYGKSLFRIEKRNNQWAITNLTNNATRIVGASDYERGLVFGRGIDVTDPALLNRGDNEFSRKHFAITFHENECTVVSKSRSRPTEVWYSEEGYAWKNADRQKARYFVNLSGLPALQHFSRALFGPHVMKKRKKMKFSDFGKQIDFIREEARKFSGGREGGTIFILSDEGKALICSLLGRPPSDEMKKEDLLVDFLVHEYTEGSLGSY